MAKFKEEHSFESDNGVGVSVQWGDEEPVKNQCPIVSSTRYGPGPTTAAKPQRGMILLSWADKFASSATFAILSPEDRLRLAGILLRGAGAAGELHAYRETLEFIATGECKDPRDALAYFTVMKVNAKDVLEKFPVTPKRNEDGDRKEIG